jgi:hypothetical protein
MDRSTAESLMSIYERLGITMAEANDIIQQLPESERKPHVRALGTMMQDLWLNLQLPIVREHRELDPDGTRFQQGDE